MNLNTPVRLMAVVALLSASLVQGASAAAHRVVVASPNVVGRSAPANPVRAGQFGGGFGTGPDLALVATFDKNADGRLDSAERRAAREHVESAGLIRNRGGRSGLGNTSTGRHVTPDSVRPYPATPFYDSATIRTLFLTFDGDDWERELMAFRRTDIDVPAMLTIDGRRYADVGVQFHGNSSFIGVPMGFKHSMRIALDFVHDKQDVQSYNTLLLLNAHEDPSFLRTVLALQIARGYIPAPQASFVRVVINGESWGLYVNQQQFNKDLIREWFKTTDGARWKVPGTRGDWGSGLSYLGDDVAAYRRVYEIKSKDDPAAWTALINLTRVLSETPADELEAAIAPMLDIDSALKFLAIDNALVNTDGYWSKASDYSLYRDPAGRFHLLPYDVNTTFTSGDGQGFGGRWGESVSLDPLQAMYDPSKALAAKLLAVPRLRTRYLGYVRDIATRWLDWDTLGPVVAKHYALIDGDIKDDTRRLYSYESFKTGPAELKAFADRRRAFLIQGTGTSR